MRCSSFTKTGRKCRRFAKIDTCASHTIDTCVICMDSCKTQKKLVCSHAFHPECIIRWFHDSNECPVCRTPQNDDPIIQLKLATEERMRTLYKDAIDDLERRVARRRRN